jgi:hypothetical protein
VFPIGTELKVAVVTPHQLYRLTGLSAQCLVACLTPLLCLNFFAANLNIDIHPSCRR